MKLSKARKEQVLKILRGAAIAGMGAALVSLSQTLMQQDFGRWTPWISAIASVILNTAKVITKI